MQQSEETLREVLLYAREHGFRLTRAQIHRYQQNGLIEKRTVGLGRGKGTETRYRAGTGEQLVAACKAMKKCKSFRKARLQLWWEGWRIDPIRIRKDLFAHIAASRKSRALPRSVRRRLNPAQAKRFKQVFGPLFSAKASEPISDADEHLLFIGTGIEQRVVQEMRRPDYWPAAGVKNILKLASQQFAAGALKSAVKRATDAELASARDEVKSAFAALPYLLDSPVLLPLRRVVAGLAKLSADEQQWTLVLWLSVRRSPVAQRIFGDFLSFAHSAALHTGNK